MALKKNATIGCMATFPRRFPIIRRVIDSIAPQLDHLFIYVNESTDDFPSLLPHKNVTVLDGRDYAGNLSANAKIYPLRWAKDCRVFVLDDDFVFPPDYVSRNLHYLTLFDGRCIVTTHGGILPPKVDWYYERTTVMASARGVNSLQLCSLAGSGTLCFDQRHLKLNLDEFLDKVWVDLKVSLLAREALLPIWVIPRAEKWLEPIPSLGLWEQFRSQGLTHHTHFARDVDWSFPVYADIANASLRQAGLTTQDLGIDHELAHCLRTKEPPSIWKKGFTSFRTRAQYLNLLRSQELATS